jgi:hypothetical protein
MEMKLTDYIKELIKDYFIIFAIIVICITVLRQIFSPNEYFELKDIYIYMICSLIGSLPSLIFYSPKEISEKEMRLRRIIHFIVLEAILLTLANVTGWVTGILNTILFALQISIIYGLVRFLSWRDDRKAALRINEKLKAMKDEIGNEMEEE